MIEANKTYLVSDDIMIEEYYIVHNGDWYDRNQIQQVRNGWTLNVKTGSNDAGGNWNEPEHLFRWDSSVSDSHDGEFHFPVSENGTLTNEYGYCIKCFSSHRAWWIKEYKNEMLPMGKYKLELNYYDDNFMDYINGQKIKPTDPLSFEVKLNVGDKTTGWILSNFQTENTVISTFEITEASQAGFEMRGRWGLMNVGVFLRYFKVTKIEDIPEPSETLEDHLVGFTQDQQVIDYNSLAAIEREIVSDSFTPYSQEKWESYDNTNYAIQGARRLGSNFQRVYYTTVGEWSNIDYIIQNGEPNNDIKLDITTRYSQRDNRWRNEKLGE